MTRDFSEISDIYIYSFAAWKENETQRETWGFVNLSKQISKHFMHDILYLSF